MTEKEITIELRRPEVIALFLILGIVFFLELQVTLNSPIAFGDEGHHTYIARDIGEKKDYSAWQTKYGTEIDKYGFHEKPLWHILEGSFYLIFGFHEAIVKILTPFIGSILVGLSTYVLVKKIYDEKIGFISSIISITVPSFVTYSVLVYTDALFVFYFSLFALTLILAVKTNETKYWIISGIFAAFSFLTKNTGYAIFPLIGIVFLYRFLNQKKLLKPLKEFSILAIFFFLISGTFFIRSFVYYKTPDCYSDIFNITGCNRLSNYKDQFKYEGRTEQTGTEVDVFRIGVMNYLNFAYGNIWLVVLGFFCGLFIFTLRKSENDILIILMLLASIPIFYVSVGGRAEDTARYTLGWIPLISVVAGKYFEEAYNFIKKYQKYVAIIVFIFVIVFSFQNAIEKLNVMKQVKQFSPLFFEACDWVKNNVEEDARFGAVIWTGATIYNCERTAGGGGPDVTNSNNLTLALSVLKIQGITHLFVQKFSISWDDQKLQERYPISFVQMLENNPNYFEKIYENGPSLQQCIQSGGCDGSLIYKIDYTQKGN
jgi:hypothetical protein